MSTEEKDKNAIETSNQVEEDNHELKSIDKEIEKSSNDNKIEEKQNNITKPSIKTNIINKTCTVNNNSSFFENFDIQQLTYSIMKNYSQLKINKEENFMERMKFDIYKRQIKEERVNKLVEQNKIKIEEEERIKAFNRLIEDANRRIEAQENLEQMKNKLEEDLIGPPLRKYTPEEWENIYKERFLSFLEEVNKKNEERVKEKREMERIEEQQELELCKVKKASPKKIEEASKRLYEEALKRRVKQEQRIRANYENSPSKYKKIVDSEAYAFMSDNDEGNNKEIKNGNNVQIERKSSKNKKISVTEYNNKRFNTNNTKISKPTKKKNKDFFLNFSTKERIYQDDYYDDINSNNNRSEPKPVINNMSTDKSKESKNNGYQTKDFKPKNIDKVAMDRLQNNNKPNYVGNSVNSYSYNQWNTRTMKDSEASKIVDQFFTKNLKG